MTIRCTGLELTSDSKKLTKQEKKSDKNRQLRSLANAAMARDALLSLKVSEEALICKYIDFTPFFFPSSQKPLPYTRLDPFLKILIAQHILHTQDTFQPIPFVFRLNHKLQLIDQQTLNKRIYQTLKKNLGRTPLFWTIREYDDRHTRTHTHANGEILLGQSEYQIFRDTFHDLNAPHNIPKEIVLPIGSRNKQITSYGNFYAIYNWASYANKQAFHQKTANKLNRILNQPQFDIDKQHYMTSELKRQSIEFYEKEVLKKMVELFI